MADSLGRVISRRFTRWQQLAALAPALLLLLSLPAQAMLRCRIDGLLRPTCCCPHEGESETAGPAIKAQDCCAREAADSKPPTVAATPPDNRQLSQMTGVALAAPSVPALPPSIDRPGWAWPRHGPAREGPPLVLLKHAFLI
jgi:hypothetical protein